MNEAERLVLSKMLSLLTEEQRETMIASIRAESGRDKRGGPHPMDRVEDDAISIIDAGTFSRW